MDRLIASFPLRVVLIYALFATGWIVFSDLLLDLLLGEGGAFALWQSVKGLGFVAITVLLLFLLLRHEEQRRARLEAERYADENRFRMLAEHARDLIYRYRLGPEPGFEYVSPSATTLTGYSPEDHYTDPDLALKLVYPEDRALLEHMPQDLNAANEPLTIRWQRKDGRIIWTEQVNWLVYNEHGQPIALEGIARDISERKRVEDELRASSAQLRLLSRRLLEAQERERRLIARELHDEVGQVLTGLKLTLGVSSASASSELKASLVDAQVAISELMGRVRALSLDLRPALLDDLGLLPALNWHLERYSKRTGINVELRHQGIEERRFSSEIETVAYRTIQEALTNVARHAQVHAVQVRLLADQQRLMLRIDDNGSGFDSLVALRPGRSSGLSGMQERIELIGGMLTLETAPGAGTHIIAELPLVMAEEG